MNTKTDPDFTSCQIISVVVVMGLIVAKRGPRDSRSRVSCYVYFGLLCTCTSLNVPSFSLDSIRLNLVKITGHSYDEETRSFSDRRFLQSSGLEM